MAYEVDQAGRQDFACLNVKSNRQWPDLCEFNEEKKDDHLMLNIAIVGMGWAGQRQLEAIRELGRKVSVECLVDSDAAFLKSFMAGLDVQKIYTSYQDALNDVQVDAVSICTPHRLHHPMALAAFDAGKHVLVEKPMAMNVIEATEMIEAANKNSLRLYVAENNCYTPAAHFLHHALRVTKLIGEVTAVHYASGFRARNFGYPGRRAWLTDPRAGGTGTWMLHGIHSIAQIRYLFGEVQTIYLKEHKATSFQRHDIEGTLSGLLTFDSGISLSIVQTSETRLGPDLNGYTIYGDSGVLRATKQHYQIDYADGGDETGPQEAPFEPAELSEYAQEMEAFADYITGINEGPTTGESERRSLAVVQAGYESVATGQPIHIGTRFGDI